MFELHRLNHEICKLFPQTNHRRHHLHYLTSLTTYASTLADPLSDFEIMSRVVEFPRVAKTFSLSSSSFLLLLHELSSSPFMHHLHSRFKHFHESSNSADLILDRKLSSNRVDNSTTMQPRLFTCSFTENGN